MSWACHSPPDIGGVDATSIRSREASLTERTGWSGMETSLRNAFRNTSAIPTTPSAPLRWPRIFFLMAQPPLLYQEGNSSLTAIHTFIDRAAATYFQAEYTGLPTKKAGVAPCRGWNFCTRPLS